LHTGGTKIFDGTRGRWIVKEGYQKEGKVTGEAKGEDLPRTFFYLKGERSKEGRRVREGLTGKEVWKRKKGV